MTTYRSPNRQENQEKMLKNLAAWAGIVVCLVTVFGLLYNMLFDFVMAALFVVFLIISAVVIAVVNRRWDHALAYSWVIFTSVIVVTFAAYQEEHKIFGRLLDEITQEPIKNTKITLFDGEGVSHSTTTDNFGYFLFKGVPVGDYNVAFADTGKLIVKGIINDNPWSKYVAKSVSVGEIGATAPQLQPTVPPASTSAPTASPTQSRTSEIWQTGEFRVNVRSCTSLECDIKDVLQRREIIHVVDIIEGSPVDGDSRWLVLLDANSEEVYVHISTASRCDTC